MHADEFRKQAGTLDRDITEDGVEYQKLTQPDKFKNVMKTLRVLARATPEDKYMVVFGLQQIGEKVVMTGDGPNDADALRQADVGVAMGEQGCALA